MAAELTFLVPSRSRPKNALQLYYAFNDTCTADTKLVIICDSDDPQLTDYYTLLNGVGQVIAVTPGRRGMVAALQSGFEAYKDHLGYAVGFMGDDHRPRTVGWDRNYLDALHDLTTGFVYGNDLFQFDRIPTQVAMSSDIPLALGYLCPPEFDHLCVDVVWKDWGEAINKIVYLPDTVVEHVHYLAGKSSFDKIYAVANNSEMAAHDSAAYHAYKTERFQSDVEKLRGLVCVPTSKRRQAKKSTSTQF